MLGAMLTDVKAISRRLQARKMHYRTGRWLLKLQPPAGQEVHCAYHRQDDQYRQYCDDMEDATIRLTTESS